MPSTDPSNRDLLLVIVFQLSFCMVFLGSIVTAVRGYETLLPQVGQILGGLLAVGTLVAVFDPGQSDDSDEPA